jgi:hypothetical protein
MIKIRLTKKVIIYSLLSLVTIIGLSISYTYLTANQKTDKKINDEIPEIFKPFSLDTKIDEINKYYKEYKIIEVRRSLNVELTDYLIYKNWKIFGDVYIGILYADKNKTKIKKISLRTTDLREECMNCLDLVTYKHKDPNDKIFSLCREKNYSENLKLFNTIYKTIEKQYGKSNKTYQIEYYDGQQPDPREKSPLWERDKFSVYLVLDKQLYEGCWWGWDVNVTVEAK